VVIDAIARLMPGTLGSSGIGAAGESFSDGLVDRPHYTRPQDLEGHEVARGIGLGRSRTIHRWRLATGAGPHVVARPELLERRGMSDEERELGRIQE